MCRSAICSLFLFRVQRLHRTGFKLLAHSKSILDRLKYSEHLSIVMHHSQPLAIPGGFSRFACTEDRQHCTCVVCLETFAKIVGFACPLNCGTFTCWNCLRQSYIMASQPGGIQGGSNTNGDLLCSCNKCKYPINIVDLSKSDASSDVLLAQEDFKIRFITSKVAVEALVQQEYWIKTEYARIEQIKDADEKAAVKLRLKIIDQALTLRCPRCKTAFLDFYGCFAVHCSNNNCRCGFCAWCLTDCGHDAHQHVLECAENPRQGKDHFNTEQAFQNHHKQKRIRREQRLVRHAELNRNALDKLKELMKRDLFDLHIQQSEAFPPQVALGGYYIPAPFPESKKYCAVSSCCIQ